MNPKIPEKMKTLPAINNILRPRALPDENNYRDDARYEL
jgi:hypothetical protein